MEVRRLRYNGSSWIITLPEGMVKKLGLSSGDHCKISLSAGNTILINPAFPPEHKEAKHDKKQN